MTTEKAHNVFDLYSVNCDAIRDAEGWATYRFMNAGVKPWPFPHLEVSKWLPPSVFGMLCKTIPSASHFQTLHELGRVSASYPQERRVVLSDTLRTLPYWSALMNWLSSERFFAMLCVKFQLNGYGNYPPDILLCRDAAGFALGPHTDSPRKALALIFYFNDGNQVDPRRGTNIYTPRDYGRTCPGGPHYDVSEFVRIKSSPYRADCAFGFRKTNNSFHGVEKSERERTVLIYDIRK